jgi:hypothetical protein
MHADRILVLERGRCVQLGDHATLSRVEGPYRRLCTIQGDLDAEIEDDLSAQIEGGSSTRTEGGSSAPIEGDSGAAIGPSEVRRREAEETDSLAAPS